MIDTSIIQELSLDGLEEYYSELAGNTTVEESEFQSTLGRDLYTIPVEFYDEEDQWHQKC